MELRGAVALVTGGNGGLGQRICHALAKEGVHIAVMYAQSRDQAEGVAGELASRHQINAAAFGCDITDPGAVERVVGDVTGRFGRLDILVNDPADKDDCAGMVVTMCRTETMTGQTVVIDSGRYFH